MAYLGDIRLEDTIDFKFSTVGTTGAPTTLAGTPTLRVYVGNSITQLAYVPVLSVDFDGVTGLHNVRVVATAANGFTAATNVDIILDAGTVGGTSVVGYVVGSFSIENRSALMPTTAARKLVVDAAGLADANMVKAGPSGSGTAQTARDIGGAVPAATPGAAGGLFIAGTNAPVTITGSGTALTLTSTAANGHGLAVTGVGTGAGIVATGGNTSGTGLKAVGGTNGAGATFTGEGNSGGMTIGGGSGASGLTVSAGAASSNAAMIIQGLSTAPGLDIRGGTTSGDGIKVTTTSGHAMSLTATGTSMHGLVVTGGNGGTSDGIKAVAGTGGVPIRGDITGNITGNLSGSIGTVSANGIAAASFAAGAIDATAIANNAIDAATFAADVDAEIAAMVWNAATASYGSAGSYGEALEAVGASADPWLTNLPGAYGAGTAGKIIGDNINATISSRASQTSVDTIDDLLDTEVAAIKSDTAAILLDTGTDGVVVAAGSKTGYSLTATTGLGNQTANITGNLSGSVGSVTATVSADVVSISGSAAAADNLEESTEVIGYGTCTTGGNTTSVVASAVSPASAVNDQYNGRVMIFKGNVTAALAGQATTISDYVHATLTFTVVALTTAPASGDLFTIL